jgi:uncharacterized protein (TIGR02147 family)
MNPPDLFAYTDYRTYLKDVFEYRKSRDAYFSLRYLQQRTNLDPGFFVKVTQGKVHLPLKFLPMFIQVFGFTEIEKAFFEELVAFGRAKSEREIKISYDRLLVLRCRPQAVLGQTQFEFFTQWYYAALRDVIGIVHFYGNDWEWLGNQLTPAIGAEQARGAIDVLLRLGLVTIAESGEFMITQLAVTTGERYRSGAVRQFQAEMIRMASEAVERHLPENREISSLTLSVSEKDFQCIRNRIGEVRREIQKMVAETPDEADRVVQVNFQVFPVAMLKNGAIEPGVSHE